MQNKLIIIVSLFLFIILGLFVDNADYFTNMRNKLQSRDILSPRLNFGKEGLILRKMGFNYIPPAENIFDEDDKKSSSNIKIDESKFTSKKGWEDPKNTPPEKMLSSMVFNQKEVIDGNPVISLVIDEENLTGPAGLYTNTFKRGRTWERLCFVSYFDQGKLQFATAAGIRMHGGSSRKNPPYSFRLYFREKYGAKEFTANIFDESCHPIKQLVIHNDIRVSHFSNPIAYDISRRVGCITVSTKPVLLFLNGKKYMHGAYVLTERINKQFFKNHFGSKKYTFVDTQGEKLGREKNCNINLSLNHWALDKFRKMNMEYAANRIDVENLTNWWIAQLICANSDHFQGILLRRNDKPKSKWFWINWDMDRSFYNLDPDEKNKLEHFWEQKTILHEVLNGTTGKSRKDVRGIVFRRLYHEDPCYKKYFSNKMMETLNHKITKSFIKSRLDYYKRIAMDFGISTDFVEQIEIFFNNRPAFLRQLMQEYFDRPSSFRCHIKAPEGITFLVDGYEEKDYYGWYYKDYMVAIKIKNEKYRNIDWLVNGEIVPSKNGFLKYPISADTVITPIIAGQRGQVKF